MTNVPSPHLIKSNLPPIPYENWHPAVQKLGFEGRSAEKKDIQEMFDFYKTMNEPKNYLHNDQIGEYYSNQFFLKLKPIGNITLSAQIYTDCSLSVYNAELTLGRNLIEGTSFYEAAQEICKRKNLKLEYLGNINYKFKSTEPGTIDTSNNLEHIITTLNNIKYYHEAMHLIFETEGQRLADLAEILMEDKQKHRG